MTTNILPITRGTTPAYFTLTWPESATGPDGLTDCSVDVFEPSAVLAEEGVLSLDITDADARVITGTLTLTDDQWATFPPSTYFTARVIYLGGTKQACERIQLQTTVGNPAGVVSEAPNLAVALQAGSGPGYKGWSPVLANVEVDDATVVQQVTDWTGGQGAKPDTGQYIGFDGLVDNVADANNIRGDVTPAATLAKDQAVAAKTAAEAARDLALAQGTLVYNVSKFYLPGVDAGTVGRVILDAAGLVIGYQDTSGLEYRLGSDNTFQRILPERDGSAYSVTAASVPGSGVVSMAVVDGDGLTHGGITSRRQLVMTASGPAPAMPQGGTQSFDVVIYGATIAGIMAAYWLGQQGFSVCVLEPTDYVGGAIAGGLCWQDFPPAAVKTSILAGTLAGQFFRANQTAPYTTPLSSNGDRGLEPKTAQYFLREILRRSGAVVSTGVRLERGDVHVYNNKITSVMAGDTLVYGRFWINGSYEGDLGYHAGVTYTSGRESQAAYNESRAGVRPEYAYSLAGFSGLGSLVPAYPGGSSGDADDKLQSFNFRVTATQASDRLPFPRPAGYNSSSQHLQLLAQMISINGYTHFSDIFAGDLLPNGKYDLNNASIVGCDCVGLNTGYATANWAQRDTIVAAHVLQMQSVLYYLQNDTPVSALKADAQTWGLCADEFIGSPYGDGWTPTLYVREARRMVGMTVLTQADQETAASGGTPTKATRCTSWSYAFRDKHGVQYYVDPGDSTKLRMEGNLGRSTDTNYVGSQSTAAAYDIPFEAMIPQAGQITNFLDPVCLSCTSVFLASARMEGNYGNLGVAAAALAKWCLVNDRDAQDYDYATVFADSQTFTTLLKG
jgi:hypothetical protein